MKAGISSSVILLYTDTAMYAFTRTGDLVDQYFDDIVT